MNHRSEVLSDQQWDTVGPLLPELMSRGRPWRSKVDQLERNPYRRQLRAGQKRGPAVGKTNRGQGIPLGGYLGSASAAEVTWVEATLASLDPKASILPLIADQAYDSQS